MTLRRLVVALEDCNELAAFLEPADLLDVNDADAVMALAAMGDGDVGLWLRVDDEHPAALVARDLSTLARLRTLTRVVIEAIDASSQAEVVRALFSDGEVNFTNDVATLRAAYNRPAPPSPIEVGYCEGDVVHLAHETLRLASREARPWGEIVTYA